METHRTSNLTGGGITYGYIRVSTREQNIARQLDAMSKEGVERSNILIDKESGKDFDRKAYRLLTRKLKEGDIVIIKSIDRLGRNYQMIIEEWKYITQTKKAHIKVLDMPLLDTTQSIGNNALLGQFISDIVLQILSFVAENERVNIRERQMEGIRLAKERGVKFGRPPHHISEEKYAIVRRYMNKDANDPLTVKQACTLAGCNRTRFYQLLHKLQKEKQEATA